MTLLMKSPVKPCHRCQTEACTVWNGFETILVHTGIGNLMEINAIFAAIIKKQVIK